MKLLRLFCFIPFFLSAANIPPDALLVNSTADPTAAGKVTLRDAVMQINTPASPFIYVLFDASLSGQQIKLTSDMTTLNNLNPASSGIALGQNNANVRVDGQGFQIFGFAPSNPTLFFLNGMTLFNGSINASNSNVFLTLGGTVTFGANTTLNLSSGATFSGSLSLVNSTVNVDGSTLNGNVTVLAGSNLNLLNGATLNGNAQAYGLFVSPGSIAVNGSLLNGSVVLDANGILRVGNGGQITAPVVAQGRDATQLAKVYVNDGAAQFATVQLNQDAALYLSGTGSTAAPITLNGSTPKDLAILDISGTGSLTTSPTFTQYGLLNLHDGAVLPLAVSVKKFSTLQLANAAVGTGSAKVEVDASSSLQVFPAGGAIPYLDNQGNMTLYGPLTLSTFKDTLVPNYIDSGVIAFGIDTPSSGLMNVDSATFENGIVKLAQGSEIFIKGSIAPIVNYNAMNGFPQLSLFDQERMVLLAPGVAGYPGPSSLSYADSIYIYLIKNIIGANPFSGNAGVVQRYLQDAVLSPDLEAIFYDLNRLPDPELRVALEHLSPAQYGAFDWNSSFLMNQIANLFAKQGICNYACEGNQYFWVAGSWEQLKERRIEELEGFLAESGGIFAGYEHEVASVWSLGVLAGYNRGHLKWHEHLGFSDFQLATGGLHINYCECELDADLLVLFGWQQYKAHRDIAFPGLIPPRTARSTTDGWAATTRFQIEKAFVDNGWTFTPYGWVEYTYLQHGRIRERGAKSLTLDVPQHTASFFRAAIGPSFSRALFLPWATMTPMVRFAWNWIVPTSGKRFQAAMEGQDFDMRVLSSKRNINYPSLEFLLVSDFCFDMDLLLSYENQFASEFLNQSVTVAFAWDF